MTVGLKIRELTPTDAGELSKVALAAYADHYLDLWHDRGQWYIDRYFSAKQLSRELKDNNTLFYLVELHGLSVGFLKINKDAPIQEYDAKEALELERIYLKKEASRLGIGKALLDLTFRIASDYNKKIVWLKAMDSSTGPIDFYNKMGFTTIGTHQLKHPLMKEELRGMVVMIKNLEEQ